MVRTNLYGLFCCLLNRHYLLYH